MAGASCSGSWVGEFGGTWEGSFDDSNIIDLNREINQRVQRIETASTSSYGFQAQFNLLSGNSVSVTNIQKNVTTIDTNINSLKLWAGAESGKTFQNGVDSVLKNTTDVLNTVLSNQRTNEKTFETIKTNINGVKSVVGTRCDALDSSIKKAVSDATSELYDKIKLDLFKVVGALAQCFQFSLYPVCSLFEDKSTDKSVTLNLNSDFVSSYIGDSKSNCLDWSFSSENLTLVARPPSNYLPFSPEVVSAPDSFGSSDAGSSEELRYWYSSELKDVLSWPYVTKNSSDIGSSGSL